MTGRAGIAKHHQAGIAGKYEMNEGVRKPEDLKTLRKSRSQGSNAINR